jgi:meso-butanediol dehydrogenase/(S,S)-butanediol dehydrogenase/diacetyl reductase
VGKNNKCGAARTLDNKLVLITGGASGLGFACADLFVQRGARVLIIGRDQQKLSDACNTLGVDSASYVVGDVADSSCAQKAVTYAHDHLRSPVDILINNAGTILREHSTSTSDQQWQNVMNVNVNGVFYFSRAVAQQIQNGGAIVNVSSTCGSVGSAGLAAYCASKGAVNLLTKSMALELAERNINVNAVAPGAINSPMLFAKHAQGVNPNAVIEQNRAAIPLGELADPNEVARAVLFLATEKHITGEVLAIDGGYTAA